MKFLHEIKQIVLILGISKDRDVKIGSQCNILGAIDFLLHVVSISYHYSLTWRPCWPFQSCADSYSYVQQPQSDSNLSAGSHHSSGGSEEYNSYMQQVIRNIVSIYVHVFIASSSCRTPPSYLFWL